jgi:hypothetical protein
MAHHHMNASSLFYAQTQIPGEINESKVPDDMVPAEGSLEKNMPCL